MAARAGAPSYLGDAVYASFDENVVWLHLNSHLEQPLVVLELEVAVNLLRYFKESWPDADWS